jgi:hypothetical protein
MGHWYLVGNELIQAPDPRVDGLLDSQRLDPIQLAKAITDIQGGKVYDLEEGWEEEIDDGLLPEEYYKQ